MRRRTLILGILAVSLVTAGRPAAAASAGPFVKRLADQVLAIFNDSRLTFPEREQRMRDLTVRDFDVPYSARFALGRYWLQATDGERTEFTKAFERYIVHVYAMQFDLYHDVDFKVLSERSETPTISVVHSQIVRHNGRPPITVDWRVATDGNVQKIRDVSVEGISQLLCQRDQFAALLTREEGGVAMLTRRLGDMTTAR